MRVRCEATRSQDQGEKFNVGKGTALFLTLRGYIGPAPIQMTVANFAIGSMILRTSIASKWTRGTLGATGECKVQHHVTLLVASSGSHPSKIVALDRCQQLIADGSQFRRPGPAWIPVVRAGYCLPKTRPRTAWCSSGRFLPRMNSLSTTVDVPACNRPNE